MATRLTRKPCKKVSNLIRRSWITLKKCQTAFLSLQDYRYDILNMYKHTIRGLSSQNIENQQITSANYTVLMQRVRQSWHKKAIGRSPS